MRPIQPLILTAPVLILLGSCVGPAPRRAIPAPAQTARPAPASLPAQPADATPPQAGEWQYRPVTPGDWRWRSDVALSVASFGPTAADTRLSIRCDRAARRVTIIRTGTGQGAIVLRTSYGAVNWPATTATAPLPQTVAVRASADAALDQIAYSRGKIAVEVTGLSPLIVPAWPEISRVIEDCRG